MPGNAAGRDHAISSSRTQVTAERLLGCGTAGAATQHRSNRVAAEGLAAVDLDEVAVDVAGLVGGEEDGQVGDVVDLASPLERDGVGEDLVEVLVVEQLPGHGRCCCEG
jgi:hypothetical protein